MSLQHVTVELREEDTAAEVEFWRLLGFERVEPPPPLNEIAVWVQRDGTQIHFLFTEQPVVPQGGHVAIVAEDFPAAFAALTDAGFAPEEHRRPWIRARSANTGMASGVAATGTRLAPE